MVLVAPMPDLRAVPPCGREAHDDWLSILPVVRRWPDAQAFHFVKQRCAL